jgi:uncharacterized membrane protein (DUF106 family)
MSNFLDAIFNPVFGPLLKLHPFLTIFIVSFLITFLVTIVYKFTTDQKLLKKLKEDLKLYQKGMRAEKDTKKMMEIQKKAMDANMKYMMASFKSTLYTFIPIIIIFAWLNSHIAYYPLYPNQNFNVTAEFAEGAAGIVSLNATPDLTFISAQTYNITSDKLKYQWTLKGEKGEYMLNLKYNEEAYNKKILITEERTYELPLQTIKNSKLRTIKIENQQVHPFGNFSLFGWLPGWLSTYIVISIGLSMLFRKIFNLY